MVYLGLVSHNFCKEEWFLRGCHIPFRKGGGLDFAVRVICVGVTYGQYDWRCSLTIIKAIFCSCCVISAISAVIGSTGNFDGELSWIEGVGGVDIKVKYRIVDGEIFGSIGGIALVICSPRWRPRHAALEENGVK